jgi:hypothetical protein
MSKCKRKDFQDEQFSWLESYDKNIGIKLPENQPRDGLKFTVYIKNKKSFYKKIDNQYDTFCRAIFFHIGWTEAWFEKDTKKKFYNEFKEEFVWLYLVFKYYSNLPVTFSAFPRWLKRLYLNFLNSPAANNNKRRKLSEAERSKVKLPAIKYLLNYCLEDAYKTDLEIYQRADMGIDSSGYLIKHVYKDQTGQKLYQQYFEGKVPNEIEDLLSNSTEAVYFRNALRKLKVM